MAENGGLSRNQERFLQALLLGQKVGEAATFAGVSERTATRWMQDSLLQSERTRREQELAEAEQAEIQRILTSGYAAVHNRVQALDQLARDLEKPYTSKTGKVYRLADNPEKVREWRACLDDIAKELGQRVRRQEIEHGGLVEVLAAEHVSLLAELEALPDAGQVKAEDTATAADSD